MRFKQAWQFIIAAFAIGQVGATITLLMLPIVKSNPSYTDVKKPNFFYTMSSVFGKSGAKSLNTYSIKAIFATQNGGFLLFYDNSKQVVLDVGEEYGGYKLVSIESDKAIFEMDGRRYESFLTKNEEQKQTISKKNIDKLFNNPADLIGEIDVTQTEGGLSVVRIKSGGVFDKMGLMVGDILKNVNGEKLSTMSSLAAALPVLQNANEVKLQILRNNQEKELTYAIK